MIYLSDMKFIKMKYRILFFYAVFLLIALALAIILGERTCAWLIPKADLKAFIVSLLFFTATIVYELCFTHNTAVTQKNAAMINTVFGTERSFSYNLAISLIGSVAEELFFRVVLFSLSAYYFHWNQWLVAGLISLLFALLHYPQGVSGLIFSGVASVLFFITMWLSGSIVYGAALHVLVNFTELQWIIPYQYKHASSVHSETPDEPKDF